MSLAPFIIPPHQWSKGVLKTISTCLQMGTWRHAEVNDSQKVTPLNLIWRAGSRVPTNSVWGWNSNRTTYNHYTTSWVNRRENCGVRLTSSTTFFQQAQWHILRGFLDQIINVKSGGLLHYWPDYITPLLKTLYWFPHSLRIPPNLSEWSDPLQTPTSYHSSLRHGTAASQAFFPFSKHVKLISASGPLHLSLEMTPSAIFT